MAQELIVFKAEALNKLMVHYDNKGLSYIIDNYTMEQIAHMLLPQEQSRVNMFLAAIMTYIEDAKKVRDAAAELFQLWDRDEWERLEGTYDDDDDED